jgi:hypothetical protein
VFPLVQPIQPDINRRTQESTQRLIRKMSKLSTLFVVVIICAGLAATGTSQLCSSSNGMSCSCSEQGITAFTVID